MIIQFKKDFDAGAFLQRLGKDRAVDPSTGKVAFHSLFEHLDLIEVLFDGLNLHDAIPEAELRTALRQALFSEPLTRDAIERNLNRFATEYLRREPTNYVLITTVSAVGQMPATNPDPSGCHLSFATQLPSSFFEGRLAQLEAARRSLRAMPPMTATFVSIAATGRSDHQAAEKALIALDLQRGIWNFLLNTRTLTNITFMGIRRPINLICLGPVHTLHLPDGRLATDAFWYEPEYLGAEKTTDISAQSRELSEKAAKLTDLVGAKRPEYATAIRMALVRYARVLDDANWESAFVGLWSLLEFLTGTVNARYDEMVRRVTYLSEDHKYARQVLDHLREHRNAVVHSRQYSSAIELHLHRLKQYVHQALYFHLQFEPSFESMTNACEFLDLPIDNEALKKRQNLAELALRFRQSGTDDSIAA